MYWTLLNYTLETVTWQILFYHNFKTIAKSEIILISYKGDDEAALLREVSSTDFPLNTDSHFAYISTQST